ncbi:Nucleoside permease NupX [Phycisphaerae bacterium RAS1]|nr:Nucleoside permease NupX [Phycisphaerae bacterium RAS1]
MALSRGLLGLFVLMLIAWLLSSDRRRVPVKIILGGLLLQFTLALLVLRTDSGRAVFDAVGHCVNVILRGADAGAAFVFGPLAGNHADVAWKAVAGIKIMTTIVVFSTLSAIGYHYGILQRVVGVMAALLNRTLGVSGAESLSGAANVFLGQTEAPLLVRPYLSRMTRSELMAVMSGGFATISMGVMGVYVDWLGSTPGGAADETRAVTFARHLLTASLMSAPAAFIMAKIMLPERDTPETVGRARVELTRETRSGLDAATAGASQGMQLAINVLAMLIAFVGLMAVIDIGLTALGRVKPIADLLTPLGVQELTLRVLLGWLFAPIAWLIGIENADLRPFGALLGTAMAANEMVAYGHLKELVAAGGMSERSIRLATYCLCGFANISSMGIQIAGIGVLAPDRRSDLVRLAPRAMLAGAMASWMTGCIAGMLS